MRFPVGLNAVDFQEALTVRLVSDVGEGIEAALDETGRTI